MSNSLAFSGFFSFLFAQVFYLHASRESRVRVRSRVIVSSLVVVDVTETLCCSCWSKWEKHHRHQGTEIPPKNVGRNDIDVVCVPLAQENKNTFVRVRIIILLLANNQMCTCGCTHPRTHLVAHAHTHTQVYTLHPASPWISAVGYFFSLPSTPIFLSLLPFSLSPLPISCTQTQLYESSAVTCICVSTSIYINERSTKK